MSKALILKLSNVVASLLERAKDVDSKNLNNKSFALRKNNTMFSESLFNTSNSNLLPYVLEVQSKIHQLEKLLDNHKNQFSFDRIQLIEQQIAAIMNAINANESQNKASQQRMDTLKKKKYRKAAQSMLMPIQSLYQKLAETHEFERRLQDMLNIKQLEMSKSNSQTEICDEILILHQRLGRCRQAISKIERQIELSEKR